MKLKENKLPTVCSLILIIRLFVYVLTHMFVLMQNESMLKVWKYFCHNTKENNTHIFFNYIIIPGSKYVLKKSYLINNIVICIIFVFVLFIICKRY